MKKRPNRQQRPANMSPLPRQRSARAGVSTRELRVATRLPETPPLGRSCSSSVGRRHAAAASLVATPPAPPRARPAAQQRARARAPGLPIRTLPCAVPGSLRPCGSAAAPAYRQTAAAPTPCSAAASLHLVSMDLVNCLA